MRIVQFGAEREDLLAWHTGGDHKTAARDKMMNPSSDEMLGAVAAFFSDMRENLLPALIFGLVGVLTLLYVRGMMRAYRAAGEGWRSMDRDVKLVFLLAVPIFRGAIKILLLADKVFYTPKVEAITKK